MDLLGTPQFTAHILAFRRTLSVSQFPRHGRGTGRWAKKRAFLPGGMLALTGECVMRGYPLPSDWRGQEGTITLTFHGSARETLSVRVVESTHSLSKNDEDTWNISLACEIIAAPTQEGFGGTQPASTEPVKSDQELYAGLSKVFDPKNLLTSATVQVDVWPLGDSDADERQRIADLVGITAARFTGAKVKYARLEPGRVYDAGVITIQQSLTDSAEDVTNPATYTTTDPNTLTSSAAAAGINVAAASPGGSFVERETTQREIHDAATFIHKTYGLRDTKEDIEMPGSPRADDAAALFRQERITRVVPTGITPATPAPTLAGVVLRTIDREQINRVQWRHSYVFGHVNSKQEIEFGESSDERDPSILTDSEPITVVTATEAPPAAPTPTIAGLVHRRTRSVRLTDSGDWKHTFLFARRTTQDDREMDASSVMTDVSQLADTTIIALVRDTATPAAPAAPAGLQHRETDIRQLHGTRWLHVYTFARNTREQDIEYDGSFIQDDPQNLEDDTVTADVTDSSVPPAPAAPAGLKHYRTHSRQLTAPGKWVHRLYYARRDSKDAIEMDGTRTDLEFFDLDSDGTTTQVYTTAGGAPADPAAPAPELLLLSQETRVLNNTLSQRVTKWGTVNSRQRREFGHNRVATDSQGIDNHKTHAIVHATGSPPADPVAPANQKLIEKFAVPVTQGYEMTVWQWGTLDSRDKIEFGYEKVVVDPRGIEDMEVQATVWNSDGAAPADPAVPAGLKLRSRADHPVRFHRKVRVWVYTQSDTVDDILLPRTVTTTDPNGLDSSATVAAFNAAPVLPAGFVARGTARVWKTPDHYVETIQGGLTTTRQDIEFPGSVARYVATDGQRLTTTTVIDDAASSVSDLAAAEGLAQKSNIAFDWAEVVRLNANKVRKTVATSDAFQLVRSRSYGGKVTVLGRLVAVVNVHMARRLRRGSTQWDVLINPITLLQVKMEMTFRRRLIANEELPLHFAGLIGKRNDRPFLGLPTGQVTYLGAEPIYNAAVAAPRVIDLTYRLMFDSLGHYDEAGIVPGWNFVSGGNLGSYSENALVPAAAFGWPAAAAPYADFSVLLP